MTYSLIETLSFDNVVMYRVDDGEKIYEYMGNPGLDIDTISAKIQADEAARLIEQQEREALLAEIEANTNG